VSPSSTAPRRLVLLRHGRTEWNHVRRAQGHAPVPLDEVGHEQAKRAALLLAELAPVRLWSSDLERAAQTAHHVAGATGLEIEYDERLREFAVGERQGMTLTEALERWPHIAGAEGFHEQLRGVPGAETEQDVVRRIVPAVEEHLEALGPGETGIAVTHGAALKLALCGLLGWPTQLAGTLGVLDNCSWAAVIRPEGRRSAKLESYGRGDFASPEGIG
jgi:broad specificity phosphatase PhoE